LSESCCSPQLVVTDPVNVIDRNEWKIQKRHECKNMEKVKQLE